MMTASKATIQMGFGAPRLRAGRLHETHWGWSAAIGWRLFGACVATAMSAPVLASSTPSSSDAAEQPAEVGTEQRSKSAEEVNLDELGAATGDAGDWSVSSGLIFSSGGGAAGVDRRSFSIPLTFDYSPFDRWTLRVSTTAVYTETEVVVGSPGPDLPDTGERFSDFGLSNVTLTAQYDWLSASGPWPNVVAALTRTQPVERGAESSSFSPEPDVSRGFPRTTIGLRVSKPLDLFTLVGRIEHTYVEPADTPEGQARDPGDRDILLGGGVLAVSSSVSVSSTLEATFTDNEELDGDTSDQGFKDRFRGNVSAFVRVSPAWFVTLGTRFPLGQGDTNSLSVNLRYEAL
jgi:hypothetical protein